MIKKEMGIEVTPQRRKLTRYAQAEIQNNQSSLSPDKPKRSGTKTRNNAAALQGRLIKGGKSYKSQNSESVKTGANQLSKSNNDDSSDSDDSSSNQSSSQIEEVKDDKPLETDDPDDVLEIENVELMSENDSQGSD